MTAAGIARLAGVGRAAVSNWRRRHADFPKPVGGTETSPSFALAEVEQWLRDQGKLAEVPLRERVWQQLAGHPAGAVTALVHAGCALLLVRDRPTAWLELAARLGRADGRAAARRAGAGAHRALRDAGRLFRSAPARRGCPPTPRLGRSRCRPSPSCAASPSSPPRPGPVRPSSSCSAATSTPTRASTPSLRPGPPR